MASSSLKAAEATEQLCDFINDRLRDRLDMECGYGGDLLMQSRHLTKVLRRYSKDPAFMECAQFHEAFLRLCVAGPGRPPGGFQVLGRAPAQ